jgi:hypothetical protein
MTIPLDKQLICFNAAGAWAKALEYTQRAGEKALELYAPTAAIEHLTHALEAADHVHVAPPSKVYHACWQAYAVRGEFDCAPRLRACAGDRPVGFPWLMEWQSMMALGFLWAERDYAQAGAWFRRVSEQASPLTLGLRTSWSWKD